MSTDTPRALVLVELIRRLHFANDQREALEGNIERLRRTPLEGLRGATANRVAALALPLPLSPETWRRAVFEHDVPDEEIFTAILTSVRARLLYHGLMALDADTRRWLGSQPALVDEIHDDEDAVRAFALFAPALRIEAGSVVVPGGALGARRWAAVLETDQTRAEEFVSRLFRRDNGRLAGLYALVASAESPRQAFLLGPSTDDEPFRQFAARFVDCYGAELPVYPFTLRQVDPALLLQHIEITPEGALAGPTWRRFWTRVLEGDDLPADPARELREVTREGAVDPAWLVEALCGAPVEARQLVFETLLFAHRRFRGVADAALPDVLLAVKARRLFPAAMTVLEQADITAPGTFASVARRAAAVSRVDAVGDAVPLLQQFQGALALTLHAVRVRTLPVAAGTRLLDSLTAVPIVDGRYDGRLAAWFASDWLPAVAGAAGGAIDRMPEALLLDALSGPPGTRERVQWEGLDYVFDLAAASRRQLRDARQRQGGMALDTVMALSALVVGLDAAGVTVEAVASTRTALAEVAERVQFQPASEFQGDVLDVDERVRDAVRDLGRIGERRDLSRARRVARDLAPVVDVLFGQVLTAWAYAPHLGDGGSTLGGGGDPSLRHEFGLRLPERSRLTRRWEIAWRGEADGRVTGALLGLDAALARRTLRRLVAGLPPEPALTMNDVASMQLTVALSDPRAMTNDGRDRITGAVTAGAAAVEAAGRDGEAWDRLAAAAGVSPWRRQALAWTVVTEPERLAVWFSPEELAWMGGLSARAVDGWGTAFLPSGCLCLRMPRSQPVEVLAARHATAALPALAVGLSFRIAPVLAAHRLPAPVAAWVLRYAVREVIDRVRPAHAADSAAFTYAIGQIDRSLIEDYIGAVAALGTLVEPAETEQ